MGGTAPVSGLASSSAGLLERADELGVLERAVSAAVDGQAGLVVIEGPAGIGKSRLVAATRALAAGRGMTVLSARGSEMERDFPFGVVRQLFEPRLAGEGVRDAILVGAASKAATVFGLPAADRDDTAAESTFAALHGLYWLTLNLSAEAPLLLAVDDLHWCDHASLRFLGYLARRLEGSPILVVAGLRPSEPGTDEALLAELAAEPTAAKVSPRPLTLDATMELARGRLGDGVELPFAVACHVSTDGNPLLLNELLKTIAAEGVVPDASHAGAVAELGPRAVSRAVLLRLARLAPDAVRVARSLAVLGDAAEAGVVAAMSDLDARALAGAVREMVRAEIVRPDPPLAFVHPLVQAAVYRDLAPGERELSHERAARLLLERRAPDEQIAAHLLMMPRHGEAWVPEVLHAAARAAFSKGAPDAAIASLRRLLDEPLPAHRRTEVLFELGRAQALMSLPDAVEALRSAFESASDPMTRGNAADWLVCTLNFLDAPDEAAEIARRTTLELPPELDDLALQLEAGELISLFFGGRPEEDERLERLRRHRSIDPAAGAGAKMLAAVVAWEWAESAGPVDSVVALARAALRDGTLVSAEAGELVVGGIFPLALADLDEAVEWWDVVRSEAHRSGYVFTMLAVQLWGGYTHYLRGDLGEAEADLRAAVSTTALWGVPAQQAWAAGVLAEILVDRGLLSEARTLLDGAAIPHPASDPAIVLDRARAGLLLAEGRPQDALGAADALRDHAGWRRHPRYVPWRSLKAEALHRLGRDREARELAAEELEVAREWGSPATVGRSLRVLAGIDGPQGVRRLEEACALLATAPAQLEQARALVALGAALRRARRPSDARQPLLQGLELAEICGAAPLVHEARAELHATGARPRRTALHGVRSLTSSERRVADLAAGGSSNRDIAQTLYVTPKTVEVHLSNVYRKLGIASRRNLSSALAAPA